MGNDFFNITFILGNGRVRFFVLKVNFRYFFRFDGIGLITTFVICYKMIIYENNWDGGGGPVLKHLCVFVVRVEKKYIFQTLHVDNNQVMHV